MKIPPLFPAHPGQPHAWAPVPGTAHTFRCPCGAKCQRSKKGELIAFQAGPVRGWRMDGDGERL